MLRTKEDRDATAGPIEDRSRRTQRTIHACCVREQSHVSACDEADCVRITVGNAVQPCSNARQTESPTAGDSAASPANK
jgi:hypothetical protein